MEEITLTTGQFRILRDWAIASERAADEAAASLRLVLDGARVNGHRRHVTMAEKDIATALDVFTANKLEKRTPGGTMAWQYFIRESSTAWRLYDTSRTVPSVPRETSPEES